MHDNYDNLPTAIKNLVEGYFTSRPDQNQLFLIVRNYPDLVTHLRDNVIDDGEGSMPQWVRFTRQSKWEKSDVFEYEVPTA